MRIACTFIGDLINSGRVRMFGLAAIVIGGVLPAFFFLSCYHLTGPAEPELAPFPAKAWTLMLYDDADFQNAYDPLDDFAASAYAGKNINVLVLQDQEKGPAKIWYIDENHTKVPVKNLGEANMGSDATLSDFISFAKSKFPSDRTIISFYDHGGGWQGACWDVTNNNDFLSMDEMKKGIDRAGGVDVVMFSAPCLMGAVESVYELRSSAQVFIGSANTSGYCFWMEPMSDLRAALENNPAISTTDLGSRMVSSIKERSIRWQSYGDDKILTMSAVTTDRINALVAAVDSLSLEYLADVPAFKRAVVSVFNDVQTYSASYVDLYSLVDNLLGAETRQSTRTRLENVKRSLVAAVQAECHGVDCPDSHGLNIYFPFPSQPVYLTVYQNLGLDFAADTHWGQLISHYALSQQAGKQMAAIHAPTQTNGFAPIAHGK